MLKRPYKHIYVRIRVCRFKDCLLKMTMWSASGTGTAETWQATANITLHSPYVRGAVPYEGTWLGMYIRAV